MPYATPPLPDPESHSLKDGTQVVIRPIRPEDADNLQATFQRLSMESIYLRFMSFKKGLTDEEARQLATVDYTSRMAFVATIRQEDRELVVGVSRYALLDPTHSNIAESAVVVEDEYQGRGLGKLLLRKLVEYARQVGIQFMRGHMQAGNTRMLDIVRHSGLPYETRYVDGMWEVSIDIRPAQAENERPGSPHPA